MDATRLRALQLPGKSPPRFPRMDVVIPGSQIPRWFKYQNVGSSISMDPSPILHDKNCIGIAFCVAFLTRNDPSNLGDERGPLMFRFSNEKKWHFMFNHFPVLIRNDLVTVESEHLWLVYYPRERFTNIMETWECNGTIKFDIVTGQPRGLHLEVKSKGLCIFSQIYHMIASS